MAKLKMKSVQIVALKKDRKTLLEHLQDSALVQIKKAEKINKGFNKTSVVSQMQVFERNVNLTQQAMQILYNLSPEKKSILDSFSGAKVIDPDDIGEISKKSGDVIDVCNRIVSLNKQCAENTAEIARTKTALVQLEPWRNLDIPLNSTGSQTTEILIGSFAKQYDLEQICKLVASANSKLLFELEIVYSSKDITCVVFFVPKEQKVVAESTLRDLGFAKPMNLCKLVPLEEVKRLNELIVTLEKSSETAKKEISSFANMREDIKFTQDFFRIRADKYNIISELEQSRNVFVITGYVPEEDCQRLENLCNRVSTCYIEFADASEEESPVKLKNNKFSQPAESIVTMYSPPSHSDIDPTPLLAFFFYFFFGMMFSDAGYGLLMILGTGFIIKKFKPDKSMRSSLKLFQYCGVSTLIWGLIYGSIFGDAPVALYNHFTGATLKMADILPWPTLDPQKDALLIMGMSIAFGFVHILVGMGCKFYICWRAKDYKGALFDTGLWMLMLVGFAVLAVGVFTGAGICVTIGAVIAIGCAVGLVLTQGRSKKGAGKIVSGLASLYDITGYISDLLSYSRLLALGLTTGVMAQVFNMLATMFGTSAFSFIPMIIILVAGHAINIGLNALGSYVHTMRLQYVEMFSKFYEGGGKQFEPFSLKSKYIKIQEEKIK